MTVSLLNKWRLLGVIMGDPALPGSARSVAYFLLDHLNTQSERCDPSLIGLAERMGMSRRSVVSGINALIEKGYIERVAGGAVTDLIGSVRFSWFSHPRLKMFSRCVVR